jgi:hypothetical protein
VCVRHQLFAGHTRQTTIDLLDAVCRLLGTHLGAGDKCRDGNAIAAHKLPVSQQRCSAGFGQRAQRIGRRLGDRLPMPAKIKPHSSVPAS